MRKYLSFGMGIAGVTTILSGFSYLKTGFFAVHDPTHISRVVLLWQAIESGQIPAIWAGEAASGFGYPLFHFYAPAFYYLVLLFKLISPTYLGALKITVLALSFVGTLGMYKLASRFGRGVAALSALAFAFVPYRAVTMYVRGSYAEFMATMLLPWIFLTWTNLKGIKKQLVAGVVMSLFVLSHNLIPLITLPFIIIWILWKNHKALKNLILPSMLVIGLTCFYTLPVIFERNFIHLERQALATDYALHFVAPSQLWNSTWGFGGSAPGLEDGISFKLGKLQIVLAVLGLLALLRRPSTRLLSLFYLGLTMISIFMMTSYSLFVWDWIKPLQYVQFPWRFMTLATFGLSFLAGFSSLLFRRRILKVLFLLISSCLLLIINLKLFTREVHESLSDQDFTSPEFLASSVAQKVPEYLPVWQSDFPSTRAEQVPSRVIMEEDGEYVVDRAYYPTWQVEVDGEHVAYYPASDGRLAFDLSSGTHDLALSQGHTALEFYCSLVSLFTLIGVGYLYVRA